MEQSTLDFLLTQLASSLDNYHELETLKKDIYEYALFMADVYSIPLYFSEYTQIHSQFLKYLSEHRYKENEFTPFQRHLMIRCLFEGGQFLELDLFVRPHLSDEAMEILYQQYFG